MSESTEGIGWTPVMAKVWWKKKIVVTIAHSSLHQPKDNIVVWLRGEQSGGTPVLPL